LSRTELSNILAQRPQTLGLIGPYALPADSIIDNAIAYAQEKVKIREEVTSSLRREFEVQKTSEGVAKESVNLDAERTYVEDRRRVIERFAKPDGASVYGRVGEISENVERFTSVSPLPAGGSRREHEYTEAERVYGTGNNLPEGYYEWLNFISGFQEGLEVRVREDREMKTKILGRAEAFEKAIELIPPELLARALNDELTLGIAGTVTITKALEATRSRGKLPENDAFAVVRSIVRRLANEAKTR
jgi:hypothetical protein